MGKRTVGWIAGGYFVNDIRKIYLVGSGRGSGAKREKRAEF